jgi:Rrf2 family transcriptional regulator, iron-sulfur cluster assembly transcription factor
MVARVRCKDVFNFLDMHTKVKYKIPVRLFISGSYLGKTDMRITTTSRYGVRALFDVAYHGGGQPTQIKDISRRQKISQRYLEQIFNKLLKAGLLKSRRGPRGGYMLARDAAEITVGDIINAAQGPIVPVRCLAHEEPKKKQCDIMSGCITRHVWQETQKLLVDYYNSVSIADFCSLARKQGVSRDLDHKYMYFI